MADDELKNENRAENQLENSSDAANVESESLPQTVTEGQKTPEKDLTIDENNKMTDANTPQLPKEKTSVESEDFKDEPYSEPLPDPYGRAIKYLEKHNIMQLFQSLTSSIVYNKPDDPISYLMTEVARIKKERDAEKENDQEIKQISQN